MKKEMLNQMLKNLKLLAVVLLSIVMVTGCTKSRDAKLPDGQDEGLYAISEVDGQEFTVTTGVKPLALNKSQKLRAYGEMDKVAVTKVEGAERLKALFKDLALTDRQSDTRLVIIKASTRVVDGYEVISNEKTLSLEEKSLVTAVDGKKLLPIFQVKVQKYGILIRSKNDLGEETSVLRLQDSTQPTHIQFSTLTTDRTPVPDEDINEKDRIFVQSRINGKVLTQGEMIEDLDINLRLAPETTLSTEVNGSELVIFEIADLSKLKFDEKTLYDAQSEKVKKCTAQILAQISADKATDCVMIARASVALGYVTPVRVQAAYDGTLDAKVTFQKMATDKGLGLIQIAKDANPKEILAGDVFALDPRSTIEVAKVKGQEFMMMRTLIDSPNNFPLVFPGAKSALEIVTFIFEENRMVVKNANALMAVNQGTAVDREEFMSIPVTYVRKEMKDEQGNLLAHPRFVKTSYDDAKAIAKLDWTKNTLPMNSSAMDYYEIGQCFSSQGNMDVSSVVQDFDKGIFNFTINSTWALAPGVGCDDGFLASGFMKLFYRTQAVYSFAERVSFKKYDKTHDQFISLDIPEKAQKNMKFGVFTFEKITAKDGNVGRYGSKQSMAMLHDFSNNKVLTYYLGGISKDNPARDKLIAATERVIVDWNKAFEKSFTNTALARDLRTQDYIKLLVEGRDVEPGTLGDIERNYIYYIEKPADSGILGMAGPNPNPRTGLIENVDVMIYGGNLKASIANTLIRAKAKKEYEKNMGLTNKAIEKLLITSKDKGTNKTGSATGAQKESSAAAASRMGNQVSKESAARMKTDILNNIEMKIKAGEKETRDFSEVLKQLESKDKLAVALKRVMNEGRSEKVLHDSARVSEISGSQMLEAFKGRVDAKTFEMLQAAAQKDQYMNKVIRNIESRTGLTVEKGEADAHDMLNMTEEEILVESYTQTLAHELGHSFGLRHNFQGSYDAANFKGDSKIPFTAEVTDRNYSSIMDYMEESLVKYDGAGPWDIHSLRAAYTKTIELHPEIVKAVKSDENGEFILAGNLRIKVIGGKFINLEDYRKVVGASTWLDFDLSKASQFPLKAYKYCTDEDTNRYPTCRQYDWGTTPEQIVINKIHEYLVRYSINNYPQDRYDFNWWATGRYVGFLFQYFTDIRHFLDESIFNLIYTGYNEEVQAHINAAYIGMNFFHSVIRNPDASALIADEDRFEDKEITSRDEVGNEVKETVVIEQKWAQDILVSGGEGRLRVRGVELDKAVALLMLTERSIGVPEYEQANLRFSYPDFEKLLFRDQMKSELDLPTVSLLGEIMNDQITPMSLTTKGFKYLTGMNELKVSTTELMRSIALQATMLNLDVITLEAKDNFSALFRFGSTLGTNVPSKVGVLTQLGTDPRSATGLKFWAFDNAIASQALYTKGAMLRGLIDKKSEISDLIAKYYIVKSGGVIAEKATGETTSSLFGDKNDLQSLEKRLTKVLTSLPKEATGGITAEQIFGYMKSQIKMAQDVEQAQENNIDMALTKEGCRIENENLAKLLPIVGLIQVALENEAIKPPKLIGEIMPYNVLESTYGTMFVNIQALSEIFYMVHPNYQYR